MMRDVLLLLNAHGRSEGRKEATGISVDRFSAEEAASAKALRQKE